MSAIKFTDEKIKFSIKKSKYVSNLHPQTAILIIHKSKYDIYILELHENSIGFLFTNAKLTNENRGVLSNYA